MEKASLIGEEPQYVKAHNSSTPELKDSLKQSIPAWCKILGTFFILIEYFAISISSFWYGEHFQATWGYPLTIIVCHQLMKFFIASLTRFSLECYNKQKRIKLSYPNMIRSIAAPGLANGLDIGLSNQAFQLLPLPIYVMTKSVTLICILYFTLSLFDLKKESLSLKTIVMEIFIGLIIFGFRKSTGFNNIGIFSGLLASYLYGYHWTTSQHILQKSIFGLQTPLDMIYHMQPWILMSTIPLALWFEGTKLYGDISIFDWTDAYNILDIVFTIGIGGSIAFCLEIIQFFIIARMSSLTLCITEISKVLVMLLIFKSTSYLNENFNVNALLICCAGIGSYIILKLLPASKKDEENIEGKIDSDLKTALLNSDESKISTIDDIIDKEKHSNEYNTNFKY